MPPARSNDESRTHLLLNWAHSIHDSYKFLTSFSPTIMLLSALRKQKSDILKYLHLFFVSRHEQLILSEIRYRCEPLRKTAAPCGTALRLQRCHAQDGNHFVEDPFLVQTVCEHEEVFKCTLSCTYASIYTHTHTHTSTRACASIFASISAAPQAVAEVYR